MIDSAVLPGPPDHLLLPVMEAAADSFAPAPDLAAAVGALFLDEESPFYVEEHSHLLYAEIGYLWTSAPARRRGRTILGTAEIFQPRGSGWAKARQEAQMLQWFGEAPDFVITLSAPYVARCLEGGSHANIGALIDHELSHCGQALDEWGAPRFNQRTGRPVFTLRGHDVEEFVGVVERWGAGATMTETLAAAANAGPRFGRADAAGLCGTCLSASRRAA